MTLNSINYITTRQATSSKVKSEYRTQNVDTEQNLPLLNDTTPSHKKMCTARTARSTKADIASNVHKLC